MKLKFTKEHTLIAKAFAIILMFIHHLFAFPERIYEGRYISLIPSLEIFGKSLEFHIGVFGNVCVAMYLFLSGYGLATADEKKEFTFKDSITRLKKLYINYWIVFFIFVPAGFLFLRKKFEGAEFIKNLMGISSSYNGEWWFFELYIALLLIFPISKKLISKNFFPSLLRIGLIYFLGALSALLMRIYPEFKFIKESHIYSLIQDAAFWQCSFFLGYISFKFRLFEIIKVMFIKRNLDNKYVYISISLSLIFFRLMLGQIGIAFEFMIAPVFIFSITNIHYGIRAVKTLNILGRHSTNMWLTHSFFCYTYFQKLTFSLKYAPLIVLQLVILNLAASAVINRIKGLRVRKKAGIYARQL